MRTKINYFKPILYCLSLLVFQSSAFAQNSFKGKVLDATTGIAVVGATVTVVKTKATTTTDGMGSFTVNATIGDQIFVSSVGFSNKTFAIGNGELLIQLTPNIDALDEVVVTALGIKREKKKLGYASQELKGENLTVARETNVVSQLAGKIATLLVSVLPV